MNHINNIIWRVLPTLLLPVFAGCASITAPDAEGALQKREAAGLSPATNGEALLKAFRSNDSAAFLAALPAELREQFGQKEFEGARRSIGETLGEPVSYEYATTLEHPLFAVSLWKVRFERRDSEGKPVRQEAIFRVISGVENGKYRVVSFNFL